MICDPDQSNFITHSVLKYSDKVLLPAVETGITTLPGHRTGENVLGIYDETDLI